MRICVTNKKYHKLMNKLIYILPMFFSLPAFCQQVSIDAGPGKNSIQLGEKVHYKITIEKASSVNIQLPVLENYLDPSIEILSENKLDTASIDETTIKLTKEYILTSFDSGLFYIQSYPLVFTINKHTDSLLVEENYLEVMPFYIDELQGELADIKSISEIGLPVKRIIMWLALFVLALALVIVVRYYIKQRNNGKQVLFYKPPRPAYEIAEEELDKLKRKKLWQHNKLKEFYSELTAIIRIYIENQFGIKALEQTTAEILNSAKQSKLFDNDTMAILSRMLLQADLVKFAKGEVNPDENATHLENACKFVRKTKVYFDNAEENKGKEELL